MNTENENQNAININLSEEMAEGEYSNLAIITHSNAEFIIDFVKIMPGIPKGNVKSRIILTPLHAKRLLNALKENIQKFESVHGHIKESDGYENFPMNIGTPKAKA